MHAAAAPQICLLTKAIEFMSGQGATIKRTAKILRDGGWEVVYICVPNACHIGVVPIPTNGGASSQRYPDVLSIKDNALRLTEVEISLTEDVGKKTIERFMEQRNALLSPIVYADWRARVLGLTGTELPLVPKVVCELVLCTRPDARLRRTIADLDGQGITVVAATDYQV